MDQWHKVSVFLSVSRHFILRQLFERSMVIQQTWLVPPQPATLRVRDFKPRKYDCGPCLRGPFLMSRFRWALNALGWFTETRRYHAYCYHWRRIGRCNGGASLDQAWRGCDLGSTQSRRSETCGATQGARQSASRSHQTGRGRGDRNALVRGRGGDQKPGQPRG